MKVTCVRLIRVGGEHTGNTEVHVQIDGKWYLLIREQWDCHYDHFASVHKSNLQEIKSC